MTHLSQLPDRISAAQYLSMLKSGQLNLDRHGRTTIGSIGSIDAPMPAAVQPTAKRKSPEEDLHRACMEWVELQTPRFPLLKWIVHVPNGGLRSRGEAGKLRAMGTKPGIPDLLLPRRCGSWTGLAIELKSGVGRLSTAQEEWLRAFAEEGYLTGVCREIGTFESTVMRFLKGISL